MTTQAPLALDDDSLEILAYHEELRAYHEAGHAVLCYLDGIIFEYITIEAGEENGGHIAHRPFTPSQLVPAQARAYLRSVLAGPAATDIQITPQVSAEARREVMALYFSPINKPGSDRNMAIVFAYVLGVAEGEIVPFVNGAYREVREILKEYWRLVETLATALLRKRTIGYDATCAILSLLAASAHWDSTT